MWAARSVRAPTRGALRGHSGKSQLFRHTKSDAIAPCHGRSTFLSLSVCCNASIGLLSTVFPYAAVLRAPARKMAHSEETRSVKQTKPHGERFSIRVPSGELLLLIPARPEQQPVVPHHPRVFKRLLPRVRVCENVADPLSCLRRAHHLVPIKVAGRIHAQSGVPP